MVRANNPFEGNNDIFLDGYLRSLHEFRVNSEVSLLPIINDLIAKYNSSEGNHLMIPGGFLYREKEFLKKLGKKYSKEEFDFEYEPAKQDTTFRNIAGLVHETRKNVGYCLNDLADFLHETDGAFRKAILNKNIAKAALEVIEMYHKIVPQELKKFIPKKSENDVGIPEIRGAGNYYAKYKSADLLYMHVLSDIKRDAIEYDALRLYDFLLETQPEELHSSALYEIQEELKALGEQHYFKKGIITKIYPTKRRDLKTADGRNEAVMEEWASNIRRELSLKNTLGMSFINYMNNNKDTTIYQGYKEGFMPELNSLVQATFSNIGMRVPEYLK